MLLTLISTTLIYRALSKKRTNSLQAVGWRRFAAWALGLGRNAKSKPVYWPVAGRNISTEAGRSTEAMSDLGPGNNGIVNNATVIKFRWDLYRASRVEWCLHYGSS
jgi:hypothetical protein